MERTNAHQVSQSELMDPGLSELGELPAGRTGLTGPVERDPAPSTPFCTQRPRYRPGLSRRDCPLTPS